MNPAMKRLSPSERLSILKEEEKWRSNGLWGPWQGETIPEGGVPGVTDADWLKKVSGVVKNKVFCVLIRTIDSKVVGGPVLHLAVTSLSGDRPTWWEMQRIKNEIAGPDVLAVEIYPPRDKVVDGADMFHIFAMPPGSSFDFGLADEEKVDEAPAAIVEAQE